MGPCRGLMSMNCVQEKTPVYLPFSVSFQTMPSRVTVVPGSHGPRQSGSVTTPTWQASTLASFMSTAGPGHGPLSTGPSVDDSVADDDEEEEDVGGIGELAISH